VLGEIGKGHLIAFNALNIGRFKLGVMCIGGNKEVINMAVAMPTSAFNSVSRLAILAQSNTNWPKWPSAILPLKVPLTALPKCMQDKKAEESAEGKSFGQATLWNPPRNTPSNAPF
jgi:hypothetical protein